MGIFYQRDKMSLPANILVYITDGLTQMLSLHLHRSNANFGLDANLLE